jgi:tetratricopeptide (TPR) repeat protein
MEVRPARWSDFINSEALAYTRLGQFGQALDYLEQTGTLTAALGHANEEHGHQWGQIGLYLEVGALEEAEKWADRLYAQREAIMPSFTHHYLTDVARVKIARGKLDEGQDILDALLSSLSADAPGINVIVIMAIAYGHLHLAQGRPEALFAGLEEQVRPFREGGFLWYLAEEHWLRGWAALALGQVDAAREALLEAQAVAKAHEERTVLWKILASLADLEEACGDDDAAEKLRDEARGVISYIVEHAG